MPVSQGAAPSAPRHYEVTMKTDQKLNMTMLCDFYELTMGNGYLKAGFQDRITYFDVYFRSVPDGGGYAIAAGLDQLIDYIEDLHFDEQDIAYLRSRGIFCEEFLNYLANFHFSGDIYAVPEGTPVFPKEPMVVVRAPAIEAQLLETFALLTVNHQSLIATKANRIVRAGQSFYLLTDSGVECLSTDGTSQWQQSLSARPQGLLADRKQMLVFCGNTVQVLTPPEAETSASGNP